MLMQYLDADDRKSYRRGDFVLYTKEQSRYGRTTDGGDPKEYQDGVTHCAYCGEEIPNAFRRKYCSARCANDAYMERRRERQMAERSKVCPVCGCRFEAKRKDSVYCSDSCRQKAYRQRKEPLR